MLFNLLYMDPAATTVLLSSVTAIAVACGATFIILWRKVKKGAQKVLHIDATANKEVEDELVINDEVALAQASEVENTQEKAVEKTDEE